MKALRARNWSPLLTGGIVAYFAAVTFSVIADRGVGLRPIEVSSSPLGVANGELVRLLSSGLVVAGKLPLVQIGATALVAVALVRRAGPGAWWGAALSGHIGSAAVAYLVIAVAIAAGTSSAEAVAHHPDFGISAVAFGTIGALAVLTIQRLGRPGHTRGDAWLAGLCLATIAISIPASVSWYGIEHPLAAAFGAAFMLLRGRRRTAAEPVVD